MSRPRCEPLDLCTLTQLPPPPPHRTDIDQQVGHAKDMALDVWMHQQHMKQNYLSNIVRDDMHAPQEWLCMSKR